MNPPLAAYVAALAALPEVGPARLAALLERGDPADVLAELAAGTFVADAPLADACRRADPVPLVRQWGVAAADLDPAALWSAHAAAGVAVRTVDDGAWPARLIGDPEPPVVLFTRGDPAVLDCRPSVAVVGTRRCSRYGWNVAHRLGADLAAAGVVVVSGLAKGIDAAAHRGALDAGEIGGAPPVGVVATGLDVVYPRESRVLWQEVADYGVLLTEAPLGTPPARWRFPARNRLIAALADAVVVVESASTGGALHTVDEALARDRPVLAVPGPVTSPVSIGTNRLLRDVAQPACDADDVLAVLGLPPRRQVDGRPAPAVGGDDATVLDAVGWTPASLDAVAARAGLALGATAAALARLEAVRLVAPDGPGTWARTAAGVTG